MADWLPCSCANWSLEVSTELHRRVSAQMPFSGVLALLPLLNPGCSRHGAHRLIGSPASRQRACRRTQLLSRPCVNICFWNTFIACWQFWDYHSEIPTVLKCSCGNQKEKKCTHMCFGYRACIKVRLEELTVLFCQRHHGNESAQTYLLLLGSWEWSRDIMLLKGEWGSLLAATGSTCSHRFLVNEKDLMAEAGHTDVSIASKNKIINSNWSFKMNAKRVQYFQIQVMHPPARTHTHTHPSVLVDTHLWGPRRWWCLVGTT